MRIFIEFPCGLSISISVSLLQRPSLFNYGTVDLNIFRERLCTPVTCHPKVIGSKNPILTPIMPVPIIGTKPSAYDCLQLVEFKIDFHKEDQVILPPEIILQPQQLSVHLKIMFGMGCPSDAELERVNSTIMTKLTYARPISIFIKINYEGLAI